MKCPECNFENGASSKSCMKCGASLINQGSKTRIIGSDSNNDDKPEVSSNQKTVIGKRPVGGFIDDPGGAENSSYTGNNNVELHNENKIKSQKNNDNSTQGPDVKCSSCGYPNPVGTKNCIKCRKSLEEVNNMDRSTNEDNDGFKYEQNIYGGPSVSNNGFKKTQNPWTQAKVTKCALKPVSRNNENDIPAKEFLNSNPKITLNRGNTDPENMNISGTTQALLTFNDGKWFIQDKSKYKTTFVLVSEPHELKKGDRILMGDRIFEFNC